MIIYEAFDSYESEAFVIKVAVEGGAELGMGFDKRTVLVM